VGAVRRRCAAATSRDKAIAIADGAVAAQGATLGPQWQRVATVKLASEDADQMDIAQIRLAQAGPDVYRSLVGTMLAPPFWEVRYAMFGGDVVGRAEEWRVAVTDDGAVRTMAHTLPESAAGAHLARDAAQSLAERALKARFDVDAKPLKVVAADEQRRPRRLVVRVRRSASPSRQR
jgi:hypothetical protein